MNGADRESSSSLSLTENVGWSVFGNVGFAASKGGFLVVLAKTTSPEDVGAFALALAVTAPILLATNMDLRHVLASDQGSDHRFSSYRRLRLLTAVATVVLAGLVAFLGPFDRHVASVIALLGVARGVWAVTDLHQGLFQKRERMDLVARSNLARGILGLTGLGVVVWWTGSVVLAVGGLALAWLVSFLFVDWPLSRKIQRRATDRDPSGGLEMTEIGAIAVTAFPLALVSLLEATPSYIPQYVVEHSLTRADLGIFAALLAIMNAGTLVSRSVGQALVPRLAGTFQDGNRSAFVRILLLASAGLVLLGLGGIVANELVGREILEVAFTSTYAAHVDLLTVLLVAGTAQFLADLLGQAVTATRWFKVKPFVLLGATAVLVAGCLALIPSHGLTGAAWAIAIGAASLVLTRVGVLTYMLYGRGDKTIPTEAAGSNPPIAPSSSPSGSRSDG